VSVAALSLYRPVWEQGEQRLAGHDEDVLTLAVAAAWPLAERHEVRRVVVVTPSPDVLEGFGVGVIARALDLGREATVELRVGGAPALVDALLEDRPGSLVVGIDLAAGAAAAAAAYLADGSGLEVTAAGRVNGSLPMRVRQVGDDHTAVYGDGRVERELATVPLVTELRGEGEPCLVGVAPGEARRLKARAVPLPTQGPAAVLFALAALAREDGAGAVRLVAVDAGSAVAADVLRAEVDVLTDERPGVPAGERPVVSQPVEVPFSMPAYARAFDAKIGLVAATCSCGEVSYPPRQLCLNCGRDRDTSPTPLARTGEIYTCVKVHVPIPGIAGPYGLAIVALDGSPVRVLAQVADAGGREAAIGERGRLVLRRVALREGVPDYGYAFQSEIGLVDEGVPA
jgi:uncharacterized OB-fold protein